LPPLSSGTPAAERKHIAINPSRRVTFDYYLPNGWEARAKYHENLGILLSFALSMLAAVTSLHAQSLLIRGGTLIDGTGRHPRLRMWVRFRLP